MKCHYVEDPETGEQVLIPGCMQVVMSNDINSCTCVHYTIPSTKKLLERRVVELENENEQLRNEIKRLRKTNEK